MINLPTVKQLRYMVALDELQHFGQAAEACYVSQSAFSIAIKELESTLNVRLVDRTSKSITITPEGRQVAAKARVWLNELENLVEGLEKQTEPLAGKLTLGVIPSIAPFFLPGLLPGLRKRFPALKLYLRERITQILYDELMAGQIDVLLLALPYELKHVEIMTLFEDPFWLACHEHTHWLDPRHYQEEGLAAESVLLLDDGHCLREHTLAACKLRDLDAVSRYAATSLFTLLHMVDSDMGITFLPEMARNSALLRETRIRVYPLPGKSYREIGLAWRKNSARGDEFKLLGRFIQEQQRAMASRAAEIDSENWMVA